MQQSNSKTNLLEHSKAKVKLYGKYLAVYLNIMHHVQYVNQVFVFDLFCGEGIYKNDTKGSPIIALDTIRNHFFANQKSCPNMTLWFNDNGMSEIEKNIYKSDRVQQINTKSFIPPNVKIEYFKEDYEKIYPTAVELVKRTRGAKGLFFIDPFGYKDIKPDDFRKMLERGNTEVFLWLPIAQMYRFVDSAMQSSFPGSEPLRLFLTELFGKVVPNFQSSREFIEHLRSRFRAYLRDLEVFVDTFILERDASNLYCLFFFTRNVRGYEKMLEAKWSIDPSRGKGHSLEKTLSLFDEIEMSGYPQKLQAFISSADYRTNRELFHFRLDNGFLPKHTNKVLRDWKREGVIECISLDGQIARGNYIEYNSPRRVGFKTVQNS